MKKRIIHFLGTGKSGAGLIVTFINERMFMCGGQDLLQCWTLADKKLSSYNISLGKLKRELSVVEKDPVRDSLYFGTTSGDIVKVTHAQNIFLISNFASFI